MIFRKQPIKKDFPHLDDPAMPVYEALNESMKDFMAASSPTLSKQMADDRANNINASPEIYFYCMPQRGLAGFKTVEYGETFENTKKWCVGLGFWDEDTLQITRAEYDEYIMLRDNPKC